MTFCLQVSISSNQLERLQSYVFPPLLSLKVNFPCSYKSDFLTFIEKVTFPHSSNQTCEIPQIPITPDLLRHVLYCLSSHKLTLLSQKRLLRTRGDIWAMNQLRYMDNEPPHLMFSSLKIPRGSPFYNHQRGTSSPPPGVEALGERDKGGGPESVPQSWHKSRAPRPQWQQVEDDARGDVPTSVWAPGLSFSSFLAVQDSSISDIVCLSVGLLEPTNNQSLGSIKE